MPRYNVIIDDRDDHYTCDDPDEAVAALCEEWGLPPRSCEQLDDWATSHGVRAEVSGEGEIQVTVG